MILSAVSIYTTVNDGFHILRQYEIIKPNIFHSYFVTNSNIIINRDKDTHALVVFLGIWYPKWCCHKWWVAHKYWSVGPADPSRPAWRRREGTLTLAHVMSTSSQATSNRQSSPSAVVPIKGWNGRNKTMNIFWWNNYQISWTHITWQIMKRWYLYGQMKYLVR